MNKNNVLELIFRNEPTHIEFVIDYLLNKGLDKQTIKSIFRTLFNSNKIEEKKGIVTIKNNTLLN